MVVMLYGDTKMLWFMVCSGVAVYEVLLEKCSQWKCPVLGHPLFLEHSFDLKFMLRECLASLNCWHTFLSFLISNERKGYKVSMVYMACNLTLTLTLTVQRHLNKNHPYNQNKFTVLHLSYQLKNILSRLPYIFLIF